MMNIYIPSYNRATTAEMMRGPLTRIPAQWQGQTFLAVHHGQREVYADVLNWLGAAVGDVTLIEATPEIAGLPLMRLHCARHAAETGADRLVMMDDDIDFLVRRDADSWQLVAQTPDDTDAMFRAIEQMLDVHSMVGISSREGNNNAGVGPPLSDNMARVNTRIMRFFGLRTDEMLALEHNRCQLHEDFDLGLQLLRSGRTNVCLHYWANGQRMTNAPGGCATYRNQERQTASAHRLAELHAPHVSLRQKVNKTDRDGMGTRTEVTIAWKMAAREGQERAGAR